jgi:hypothetical protein
VTQVVVFVYKRRARGARVLELQCRHDEKCHEVQRIQSGKPHYSKAPRRNFTGGNAVGVVVLNTKPEMHQKIGTAV